MAKKCKELIGVPDTLPEAIVYSDSPQTLIQNETYITRIYPEKFCLCGKQILAKLVYTKRFDRLVFQSNQSFELKKTCGNELCAIEGARINRTATFAKRYIKQKAVAQIEEKKKEEELAKLPPDTALYSCMGHKLDPKIKAVTLYERKT